MGISSRLQSSSPISRLVLAAGVLSTLGLGCEELGIEPDPATPSDSIVVPYQFNIEFSIEQQPDADHTARARLYDIAQAYDFTGNAGTIELSGGDAVFADGTELDILTRLQFLDKQRVDYSQTVTAGDHRHLDPPAGRRVSDCRRGWAG